MKEYTDYIDKTCRNCIHGVNYGDFGLKIKCKKGISTKPWLIHKARSCEHYELDESIYEEPKGMSQEEIRQFVAEHTHNIDNDTIVILQNNIYHDIPHETLLQDNELDNLELIRKKQQEHSFVTINPTAQTTLFRELFISHNLSPDGYFDDSKCNKLLTASDGITKFIYLKTFV